MEHRGLQLDGYQALVGLTPRARRPIYRTRYLARCSCGWAIAHSDYTDTKRLWREHLESAKREPSKEPADGRR